MLNNTLKRDSFSAQTLVIQLLYLLIPLSIINLTLSYSEEERPFALIILSNVIYLLCWAMHCLYYQKKTERIWLHLDEVIKINNATFTLMDLSKNFKNESTFLDALLKRAINLVPHANAGSIGLIDKQTQNLKFVSVYGLDKAKIQSVTLNTKNTFQYRLTQGKCDKVIIVNYEEDIEQDKSLTFKQRETLLHATSRPIKSTLSSPIHVNNELYATLNLDSFSADCFTDYDINLATILTNEACHAISLYQKNKQIEKFANTDPLTGLNNRRKFKSLLHQLSFINKSYYLVVLDMDNLKHLNDSLGHHIGDLALKTVAHTLAQYWSAPSIIGRFGGDEFICIYNGNKQMLLSSIKCIQDKLILSQYHIECSIGFAPYQGDFKRAFYQADKAMYAIKQQNKRKVILDNLD